MSDSVASQPDLAQAIGDQFRQAGELMVEILELIHGPRSENLKVRDQLMKLIDEVFISYLFSKHGVTAERIQNEFGPGPSRDKLVAEVVAKTTPEELLTALTFAVAQVTNTYFTTVQDKMTDEVRIQITTLLKEKVQ